MHATRSFWNRRLYSTVQSASVGDLASIIQSYARRQLEHRNRATTGFTPLAECTPTAASPPTPFAISRLLEEDPELGLAVIERLSPDRRRYFLVSASASEWYEPQRALSKVDQVDADGDAKISATEYTAFIEETVTSKQSVSWWVLLLVALHAGAPFVAFGFLDNSLMILSGDAIDATFGERLALSAMGAAALGGVCSGALGVQFHGLTQRAVSYILPAVPELKYRHRRIRIATRAGMTGGIALGLCLGMLPLMFVHTGSDTHH